MKLKLLIKQLIKKNDNFYKFLLYVQRDILRIPPRNLYQLLQTTGENLVAPIFVKVGANDGVTNDPCGRTFLENSNWKGLLIEPVPYCVDKLQKIYHDPRFIIEQCAIGNSTCSSVFYHVSEEAKNHLKDLPEWYDQIGSFNRDHILKHLDGALEPYIIENTINILPLTLVLEKRDINQIDFLHVDTEGYDLEVLKSLNFNKFKPLFLYIEHKHLSMSDKNELINLLKSNDYQIFEEFCDFLAIHTRFYTELKIRKNKI